MSQFVFFFVGGNWYCGLLKMSKYSECDFMRFLRRCDVGFDVSQFLKSSLIFRKLMGFDGGADIFIGIELGFDEG